MGIFLKDLSQGCQYHWRCSTIKMTFTDLLNKIYPCLKPGWCSNLLFMMLMLE